MMSAPTPSPLRPLDLPPLTGAQRTNLRALPTEIVAGLRVLRDEPPPNVTRPDLWDEIARDAIMLAADGWAGQALGLGWTPLELFGCAADRWGDDDLLGLAGRLAGRVMIVITDDTAHTSGGRVDRARPPHQPGSVTFLWSYGR